MYVFSKVDKFSTYVFSDFKIFEESNNIRGGGGAGWGGGGEREDDEGVKSQNKILP